jgi:hypothetical protein
MSAATARAAASVARFRSLGMIEIRGRAEAVEVFSADEAPTTGTTAISLERTDASSRSSAG